MLLLVFLAVFGIAFYLNRRNFVTSLCEALIAVVLCAIFPVKAILVAAAVYFAIRFIAVHVAGRMR